MCLPTKLYDDVLIVSDFLQLWKAEKCFFNDLRVFERIIQQLAKEYQS